MRSLGIVVILSASLAFGCAFLAQGGGLGDGSATFALLGTALAISGSVFAAAGTLARQLRAAPHGAADQLPLEMSREGYRDLREKAHRPLVGEEPAAVAPAPPGSAIRRPGFHREAA
ncbi:MAG TPA: hypothetical protein VFZ01_19115 [Geminicoccaceae bacterium]